jgi:3-hydroxybutyryl-CoA dehydrogenase
MRIVVIADDEQRLKWEATVDTKHITWSKTLENDSISDADAIIDLLFENDPASFQRWKEFSGKTIMVNSNLYTLAELDHGYVRFNGWNTFLYGSLLEASALADEAKTKVEQIFKSFGKEVEWVPDLRGFISSRVISCIINEAYFALEEGVSTKEQINTAMKLGTAYPYGPFEWAEKIGLKKIALLLQKLSSEDDRYQPCSLLLKEVGF